MAYFLPSDATAGVIYFSDYFDVTKDIVVSFDYTCYGPNATGSEGFCVFFVNSYTDTNGGLTNGGPGPGLGYAYVSNINAIHESVPQNTFNGIDYGILGIGFDITGNFGSSLYGLSGLDTPVPNSITLRNNFNTNYNFIYNSGDISLSSTPITLYQCVTGDIVPVYNRARVRITDFGNRAIVDIKRPGDFTFTKLVDNPISTEWPSLSTGQLSGGVIVGLAFTTGQIPTTFKLKNFNVNGTITTVKGTDTRQYWSYTTDITGSTFTPNPTIFRITDSLSAINVDGNGNAIYSNHPILSASLITVQNGTQPFLTGDQYVILNRTSN